MSPIDFFKKNVVFRLDEFIDFMGQQPQSVKKHSYQVLLSRYVRNKKIRHVKKGLYVVNNDLASLTLAIPPFLIASKAAKDAVLAYHSALEYHGVAYTDYNVHTFISSHRTLDFSFDNQEYRCIHRRQFTHDETIEWRNVLGIDVYSTSLERTIVDVIDKPQLSGGWEEVHRSLERLITFDANKAVDYALSFNKASIISKLGYFFEEHLQQLKIEEKITDRLLPHTPKNHYYIDRKLGSGNGSLIKKWNIVVPNYLHKKQWEEPSHDIDF